MRTLLELLVVGGAYGLLTQRGKRLWQVSRPPPAGAATAAAVERVSPGPLLEEAVFDYWRAGLDDPSITTTRLDWQLWHLERFVLPALGHLRVDELEPRLLEAFAVLIKSELPPGAVLWTCEALAVVIVHVDAEAGGAARAALRAGLG